MSNNTNDELHFLDELVSVFNERIKNPSDGIFTKKASTTNNAISKFQYNDAQKAIITKIDELDNMLDSNSPDLSSLRTLALTIKKEGKIAFPIDGKYPRVGRIFTRNSTAKDGKSLFTSLPVWWYNEVIPNLRFTSGGKRSRTHKRRTHKRRTHKRRTHKRRN